MPTENQDYYFNPAGLLVMTEASHYERGTCCGNRCLHCPWEWAAVECVPEVEPPVTIRCASPEDAAEVALLARRTFASTYCKYQDDIGANLVPYLTHSFDIAKVAASFAKGDNAWWIAEDAAGAIWGYAKLSFEPRGDGHPCGMHLQRLYVRQRAHGHGIGKSLLRTVAAFAKTRGATSLWLTTLVAGGARADFYEPQGFVEVDRVVFTLGTQGFELAVMEKVID